MSQDVRLFQLDAIDHETQEVCIALRADLAQEIAYILNQASYGRNRCIFNLSRQVREAADVLSGRSRSSCRFISDSDLEEIGAPVLRCAI